jgi:hypothetical protein
MDRRIAPVTEDLPISPEEAVARTMAAGTARLRVAARLDVPEPEPPDYRGVGVVDFDKDRVWMDSDRLITMRMENAKRREMGRIARLAYPLVSAVVERMVGSRRELYFEGGALWVAAKDGSWEETAGSVTSPKHTRHPLCILNPLSRASHFSDPGDREMTVQNVAMRCYLVGLTVDQFDSAVWEEVADCGPYGNGDGVSRADSKDAVQTFVWLDDAGRIRRVVYEGSAHGSTGSILWSATEFCDFGIPLKREAPLNR